LRWLASTRAVTTKEILRHSQILTTDANEVMEPAHDRMLVILRLGREKELLPPDGVPYFNHFPAELMAAYPVTPKINRASFNEPEAIRPLEPTIT
jgi:putative SOS response-associated peptidase YedK